VLLHDNVEDCGITIEEIGGCFGPRVATIVAAFNMILAFRKHGPTRMLNFVPNRIAVAGVDNKHYCVEGTERKDFPMRVTQVPSACISGTFMTAL
jgi:hypothetical protein